MELVRQGMRSVVTSTSGTAYYPFANYGVSVAAKTGTAQNAGSDHTIFIAFAPYEEPEIAIAIVVEKGGSGSLLANAAVDIINAWFTRDGTGATAAGEDALMR